MYPYIPQQPFASNAPLASGSSGFVNSQPPGHRPCPAGGGGSSRPTLQPTSPSTSQIQPPTISAQGADPEEAVVVEDKRQRNTAASARFRIKKKQKNLNLERTVSDLTSRAEELEKEATNLRRENSWLKEMVIMKGRQNMTGGQRLREETSDSGELDREDVADGSDIDHGERSKAETKGESKAGTKGGSKAGTKGESKARANDSRIGK
ncbi:hypothetical protein JB92DRAFT_2766086 [Gautieria morchelliformis]|nr:hypothetical protein JB92DRAFT_2766086 [Gautieria morchelliformis]